MPLAFGCPLFYAIDSLYAKDQVKYEAESGPEPIDLNRHLMLQVVDSNQRRGYEAFVRKLEREAKEKLKTKETNNDNSVPQPADQPVVNIDKKVIQSRQFIDKSTSGGAEQDKFATEKLIGVVDSAEKLKDLKSNIDVKEISNASLQYDYVQVLHHQ